MRNTLHHHLLLPAYETILKRRKTFSYYRELKQSQWLSRSELEARQLASLRHLLAHASQNSPYYRERWRKLGIDSRDVRSLDHFRAWPIIDRTTILANREAMRAVAPAMRVVHKSTGGSTGEPLHFDLNEDSAERRSAATFRGYEWAGARPGSKQLHLWGGSLEQRSARERVKDQLYHRLYRRRFLSTFELGEETLNDYLCTHNRYRPDVIVAYTNSLYEFARMLADRKLAPVAPESIVVGAEKLHRFQRELIESVFNAPVFETYGSREFMLMAAECERHSLHLTHEYLLLEVVDEEGRQVPDGVEGDVVVTDLFNYGMPFVRYRNGDRAVATAELCPCGRGLPLVKSISGRRVDIIRTPEGRRISGVFFPHLLKDYPSVRRFQVVQNRLDSVELRIVAGGTWNEAERRGIEAVITEKLGPSVRFRLVRMDEIPLTASGKLRPVISTCSEAEGHVPEAAAAIEAQF